jgi:cyclohexa-1,5-dienecarbonyl-CoA hydratase
MGRDHFTHMTFDQSDTISTITLNRPPLNVMNIEMLEEMASALNTVVTSQPKILLLKGEGKAFCAGVDVSDHTGEKASRMISSFHRVFHIMSRMMTPTIAAVRGACLGGGCELATFCDLVIASENSKFGQPEIKVGVIAPVAAAFFPKMIGCRRTLELLLTGATIDAAEASRIGLINRAVPDEDFDAVVEETIKTLTALSGPVLRMNKRAVLEGLELDFERALGGVEDIYLNELMKTEDAKEGLAAFMEKRSPNWKEK